MVCVDKRHRSGRTRTDRQTLALWSAVRPSAASGQELSITTHQCRQKYYYIL